MGQSFCHDGSARSPPEWNAEEEVSHLRDVPPGALLEMQVGISELCSSLFLTGHSLEEIPREPMSESALAWWKEFVRNGRESLGG